MDWQERILTGKTGDKHIADVRTPTGVTIEFQHSKLSHGEQETREEFYGNMIWVVDASNGNTGCSKFLENIQFWSERGRTPNQVGNRFNPVLAKITTRWLVARRPVFLDFGGSYVWSISVKRDGWAKYALEISKDEFVRSLTFDWNPVDHLSPWEVRAI